MLINNFLTLIGIVIAVRNLWREVFARESVLSDKFGDITLFQLHVLNLRDTHILMRVVNARIDDRDEHAFSLESKSELIPNRGCLRHVGRIEHRQLIDRDFHDVHHSGKLADFLKIAALCHATEAVDEIAVAVDHFTARNLANCVANRFLRRNDTALRFP